MREYLKELRKNAGLNQTQVAKELGMTQMNYSAIELGKTFKMSVRTIKNLANLYNISVERILNDEWDYELKKFL